MAFELLTIQNNATLVVMSRISDDEYMHIQDGGMHNDFVDYFLCVLVNMVFAMLL
jgi:hypothetical protein